MFALFLLGFSIGLIVGYAADQILNRGKTK